MDIHIREMTVSDIPFVHNLIQQLDDYFESGHDLSIEAIQSTFDVMVKNRHMYKNYIAVKDHTIVGFISIVLYKTFFHTKGTALINELIVDTKYQGRGIGGKLIQYGVQIAHNMQMNEIEVSTTLDNIKAIRFYKKYGLIDESILLGKELVK